MPLFNVNGRRIFELDDAGADLTAGTMGKPNVIGEIGELS